MNHEKNLVMDCIDAHLRMSFAVALINSSFLNLESGWGELYVQMGEECKLCQRRKDGRTSERASEQRTRVCYSML